MSQANKPSINDKRRQLDELLAWFDSDDFVIEQAVDKYQQASDLADEIIAELEQYRNKIEVLAQRFDDTAE